MKVDFLTEGEVAQIEAFCKNEAMFEAVKKVMLQGIYSHGVNVKGKKQNPLINGAFGLVSNDVTDSIPNEQVGALLRAQWAGLYAIEQNFHNLTEIKSVKKEVGEEINNAI